MRAKDGSIRIDCRSCGYQLGFLAQDGDGRLANVDPRQQSKEPRLKLDDHSNWVSRCKCGATDRVKGESVERMFVAVQAAGLDFMPLKAPVR